MVTLSLPAIKADPAALARTAETPGIAQEPVLISLRLAEESEIDGDRPTTSLEAGGRAALFVLVRNQSGVVDNYDIHIDGVPREWWTASPAALYLVPFGSQSGTAEGEVEITFHPPRTHEAEARSWPVLVRVRSRARNADVAAAPATISIAPYLQLTSELRPTTSSGRRKASFALMVTNQANAAIDVVVSATDAEGTCRFDFANERFRADPGRRAGTSFTVRSLSRNWVGRPVDRRFELTASSATGESAVPNHGVYRQKPWAPWWLAAAAPVVAAVVVLVLMLLPDNTTVPPLAGISLVKAQGALDEAGLKLDPTSREIPSAKRAGIVVRSIPPSGSKIERGSPVILYYAMGRIPRLNERPLPYALRVLKKAGYKVEQAIEVRSPRLFNGHVVRTIPAGGKRARQGTSVTVHFAMLRVPDLRGLTKAQAATAVEERRMKLDPEVRALPSATVAEGLVVKQFPRPLHQQKQGSTITIWVSSPVHAVPDVTGMTFADADAAIRNAGLTMEIVNAGRFNPANAKVVQQSPQPAEQLEAGGVVKVVFSEPKAPAKPKASGN